MRLEEEREPLLWRWELLLPLLFCATVNVFHVMWESKIPFADVFLFKEAGFRFATEGKFIARNLPHLPPDLDFVYAYYTPIYTFLYGLWAMAFGVSLKASIAYDQSIKMLRAALAFMLVWPGLRDRYLSSGFFRILILAYFAILGLLPGYTDRPDYLASCFGILSLILLSRRGSSASAFAGGALGLAAATSPASGIFFTIIAWLFVRGWTFRAGLLIAEVFTFAACTFPVLILDPDAIYRFFAQARLSTFPLFGVPLATAISEAFKTFWLSGKLVTIPAFYICGVALLVVKRSEYRGTWLKLLLRCCLFFPVASFIWTYQFRYFIFPLLISSVSLLVILSYLWERRWAKFAFIGLLLVLAPNMFNEAKNLIKAYSLPVASRGENLREAVLQHLDPKARLAVSADQYFTFRPYKDVSMAYYVCQNLEKYDAIFISGDTMASQDARCPCHNKRKFFEVDLDLRAPYTTVLGATIPSGGVLFRKSEEPKKKDDAVALHP